MHYVIIRDDDTNASTPVECLETLYRPWLDRGLPINLAVIPEVTMDARNAEGGKEQFLFGGNGSQPPGEESGEALERGLSNLGQATNVGGQKCSGLAVAEDITADRKVRASAVADRAVRAPTCRTLPIAENQQLVSYLLDNPGYQVLQHGLHHEYLEFDRSSASALLHRLRQGSRRLLEAGFAPPKTFVAPYDKISRAGFRIIAPRFRVISTGWYELGRVPLSWWPRYALKKMRAAPHWRVGRTVLLSHPGCLLSRYRDYRATMPAILSHVNSQPLTVLVTHWWEYFRDGKTDHEFVSFLHEVLDYLASNREIKVISFSDLVNGSIELN